VFCSTHNLHYNLTLKHLIFLKFGSLLLEIYLIGHTFLVEYKPVFPVIEDDVRLGVGYLDVELYGSRFGLFVGEKYVMVFGDVVGCEDY
jgi:hypothetical protein